VSGYRGKATISKMTLRERLTKVFWPAYLCFASIGLPVPFIIIGLMFWARKFGARVPRPESGQLSSIDVGRRGGPSFIVYVTEKYHLVYEGLVIFFFVWIAVVLCFTIYAIVVGRKRKSSKPSN
jgi:hypothetical protein